VRDTERDLIAHIRDNSARLAAACTACGECYRACPMVPRTPALSNAVPEAVMAGIRDILRDGAGTSDAIDFAGACVRSGECTPACPEKLDAAFLMRLASLRVRGTLGDAARVRTPHDPRWSARVKAFARLTMSDEERAGWL
jgi:Fe-S oxidoreductase